MRLCRITLLRLVITLWALVATSATVRCAHAEGREISGLPSPLRPGTYSIELEFGGYKRTAQLHLPPQIGRDRTPMPLVLAFHGAGGSGAQLLKHYRWAAHATTQGFAVLAPDGLPAHLTSAPNFFTNPRLWNSGQLPRHLQRAKVDDVAFVSALLDVLDERRVFDPARLFVTGHSNGAGMSFRVAAEIPDRFLAVAPVAGMLAIPHPRPKHSLPTLYIVGTSDPLVPLQGGSVKSPWGKLQKTPVAEDLARWAVANGCNELPESIADDGRVRRVRYRAATEGSLVEAIYIKGHGHSWPGQRVQPFLQRWLGPSTSGFDATEQIWKFFSRIAPRPS